MPPITSSDRVTTRAVTENGLPVADNISWVTGFAYRAGMLHAEHVIREDQRPVVKQVAVAVASLVSEFQKPNLHSCVMLVKKPAVNAVSKRVE